MAPQSFAAIKKQNRLEGLLTPWSLKILTSKKPQNSFQAKHFNCHKYFQPQPSLVHVHVILIDKQMPGPNKTEPAQLVRYRYALYGTGTPPPKESPVSSMTQYMSTSCKQKACLSDELRMDVLDPHRHNYSRYICVRWHCLYWTVFSELCTQLRVMQVIGILQSSLSACFMSQEAVTDSATTSPTWLRTMLGLGYPLTRAYRPWNRQGP